MDTSTIIEGNIKFRDGKKWKSRWCVMRKLSPVADCVHLQMYRDSVTRFKQGQTKASLSLQHFLALETGFTLDKESNTMAIICQDVTVVLAFDTRERLIQWQVKIANNLGEDQQFLVQIVSVPSRAKMSTGPAHLHVQEYRFSLTAGVPPKLLGFWEISKLRRFGAVEKKFCFEGGSSCGKGEGVFVLATDQSDEISRCFHLASQGKLNTRRRPVARNLSVMESPRHMSRHNRADSVQDSCACAPFQSNWNTPSESNHWPSNESNADMSCDFGDASSLEYVDSQSQAWRSDRGIGRCVSCISKLGAPLTRSSTAATPADCRSSPFITPSCMSVSSCDSGGSEYCSPRISSNTETWKTPPSIVNEKCNCCPPARPPKPSKLSTPPQTNSPSLKPPIALPYDCSCQNNSDNMYNNYDVPRTITPVNSKDEFRLSMNSSIEEYYDTPRSIKNSLQKTHGSETFPVSVCHPCSRSVHRCNAPPCLCQRMPCCPESWFLSVSRCSSPDFVQPIQRVKLSGNGKMPVNANGNIAIYATVDKLKKMSCRENALLKTSSEIKSPEDCNQTNSDKMQSENLLDCANYVNVQPSVEKNNDNNSSINKNSADKIVVQLQSNNSGINSNYTNLEFAQSLQHYENAKDILLKTGLNESDIYKDKLCSKCGHSSNSQVKSNSEKTQNDDDYILMEPNVSEDGLSHLKPVERNEKEQLNHKNNNSPNLAEKCSSAPSLADSKLELWESHSKFNTTRSLGKCESIINQSVSATSSPYLRRHVIKCCPREESVRLRRKSISDESSHTSESTEYNKSAAYSSQSIYENETLHNSETSSVNSQPIELQIIEDIPQVNRSGYDITNQKQNNKKTIVINSTDCRDSLNSIVNIRRSSSVPCKSVNRDSSSSNDSGVSTGSLNQRGADFPEFDIILSNKRNFHENVDKANYQCLHNSLPRKSKSTDPLQGLTFQFQKDVSSKSSSAEAEIPVCPVKRNLFKGFTSPDRNTLYPGIIDSRSTSSGTSDMSDYCETLSLSSYCSDTTDYLRFSHPAVTTMRPRSGKEYQKIDRYIIEDEAKMPVVAPLKENQVDKKNENSSCS